MNDKIDPISFELGNLKASVEHLEELVSKLSADIKIEGQVVNLALAETRKAVTEAKTTSDELSKITKEMVPLVQDYQKNKNRAYGIVLAVCGIGFALGWLFDRIAKLLSIGKY